MQGFVIFSPPSLSLQLFPNKMFLPATYSLKFTKCGSRHLTSTSLPSQQLWSVDGIPMAERGKLARNHVWQPIHVPTVYYVKFGRIRYFSYFLGNIENGKTWGRWRHLAEEVKAKKKQQGGP